VRKIDLKSSEINNDMHFIHLDSVSQMHSDLWFLLLSSAVRDRRLITPSQFRR